MAFFQMEQQKVTQVSRRQEQENKAFFYEFFFLLLELEANIFKRLIQ